MHQYSSYGHKGSGSDLFSYYSSGDNVSADSIKPQLSAYFGEVAQLRG